ncbi:hypothetical protein BGZ83_006560 [Gryganskiella cystojenkinii]|nr:hypothetical protein BGZ83_006560 [Gryganskiella cystojenkinii]
MPPKKTSPASSATNARASAANFFKPSKASTTVRAAPLKNPYLINKKPTTPVTPAPPPPVVVPLRAGIQKKKPGSADEEEEDDLFGDDLDFDDVSESDFSRDSRDQSTLKRTRSNSVSSFSSSSSSSLPNDRAASAVKIDIANGIHQDDTSANEKVLRQFDLSSKYGPCLGLTRLERWERAAMLDLNPPKNVKELLDHYKTLDTPLFQGYV